MQPAATAIRRPIRLAVTVDDLFQWKGSPEFTGYGYKAIAQRITDAFRQHDIGGVYAFSNTAPVDNTPTLAAVFDHWVGSGHHIGNHTHNHASLNWLSPQKYIDDIEKTEALISKWSDLAPIRCFRHCFDMWGDTGEKRDEVLTYLNRHNYTVAPISLWFYDAQFGVAYTRALIADDKSAMSWLRRRYVETAVKQLRVQSAAASLIFDHEPAHIWLIHGMPIAADCVSAILDEFADIGVEFVSLDEALKDPMNRRQPIITPNFRNQVQKWAELKGAPIEDCPPAILAELDNVCPIPGMAGEEMIGGLVTAMAQAVGAKVELSHFRID